jgi:pyruvate kinase
VRTTGCEQPIAYKTGDVVKIFGRPEMDTTHDIINLSYSDFAADVHEGCHILFDDGALDMLVIGINGPAVIAQVQNDGVLGSHKSVNVPGVHIALPTLTEKDRKNIMLAIDQDIDFIAHSFVRSAADVRAVQAILDAYNSDIKIISKIENQEGVDNIDEIIEASYGIMIARGDLGIEVPIERIPGIQRQIIRKCVRAKKPVIVATQMLHTMINNPRPTRAEVTDIANAIYYRTDALMLSGETASGKYPVEAVRTMAAIAEQAEKDKMRENDIEVPMSPNCDIREFMSHSAIEATEKLGVKGIITDASSGDTARTLAAFRGPTPVLAICYNDKLQRLLNLSYGVIPVFQKEHIDNEELFHAAVRMLRQKGYVQENDKIAYLSGNIGEGGGTKFLEINTVKEVLTNQYKFHLPHSKK